LESDVKRCEETFVEFEERCELLLFGLWLIDDGLFVDVFGLDDTDLFNILSTVNGDAEIFGDDVILVDAVVGVPVRSASLRNDPFDDLSEGTFVANCCVFV
jgi:hypothetical protein